MQVDTHYLEKLSGKTVVKGIHSELHELVDTLRSEFGETAKTGKGSFGFYLGLLKKVPLSTLYAWRANANENNKDKSVRCRIFWWQYKKWKNGLSRPRTNMY